MITNNLLTDMEQWLVQNKGFKKRSSQDVTCRIRRLNKLLPIPNKNDKDYEYYIFHLEKNKKFLLLSVNVKSQLRRSIKLYDEYIRFINL